MTEISARQTTTFTRFGVQASALLLPVCLTFTPTVSMAELEHHVTPALHSEPISLSNKFGLLESIDWQYKSFQSTLAPYLWEPLEFDVTFSKITYPSKRFRARFTKTNTVPSIIETNEEIELLVGAEYA